MKQSANCVDGTRRVVKEMLAGSSPRVSSKPFGAAMESDVHISNGFPAFWATRML